MSKAKLKKILLKNYKEPSVYAILSGRKIPRFQVMCDCKRELGIDLLDWENIGKWIEEQEQKKEEAQQSPLLLPDSKDPRGDAESA